METITAQPSLAIGHIQKIFLTVKSHYDSKVNYTYYSMVVAVTHKDESTTTLTDLMRYCLGEPDYIAAAKRLFVSHGHLVEELDSCTIEELCKSNDIEYALNVQPKCKRDVVKAFGRKPSLANKLQLN